MRFITCLAMAIALMPAAVFSLLLLIFDNIGAVFIASGLFALGVGWVARHLPRSM